MPIFTVIALGITTVIQAFTAGMLVSTYISICNENKKDEKGDEE